MALQQSSTFTAGPWGGQSFGSTLYRLDANVIEEGTSGDIGRIKSELEFPLDGTLIGASLQLDFHTSSGKNWGVEAGIITNAGNPQSRMIDQDWRTIPGVFDGQIAYLESDIILHILSASLEGYHRFLKTNWMAMSILAHISYQNISQKGINFEGWTRNMVTMGKLQVRGYEPVIDYKVTYISPQLGGKITLDFGGGIGLDLKASAGFVFCEDDDDHLLRGKISTSEAIGFGCDATARLNLYPWFAPKKDFAISVVGQFQYYQAEGNQTQRWYRDEGEITAGTVIEEIPHEFECLQYSIGLQVVGIAGL